MTPIKLAFASDLHVPITSLAVVDLLAREIAAFEPAALVVAGDLAESLREFAECLRVLRQQMTAPILVLAGNHDLWARDYPSREKWEYRLEEVVKQAGCTWFEGQAWSHEGTAVAGTIAWYDYSAADPSLTATTDDFQREKKYYNPDGYELNWWWSDPAFAKMVAEPFLETLDRLEADPLISRIIVATHVPLVECQMTRIPDNANWAFSNAYFGNFTLGEQVLRRQKVTHIISGHTHIEKLGQLVLPEGRVVQACVIPSRYNQPYWIRLTLGEAVGD